MIENGEKTKKGGQKRRKETFLFPGEKKKRNESILQSSRVYYIASNYTPLYHCTTGKGKRPHQTTVDLRLGDWV